jgi:hypothetical protein
VSTNMPTRDAAFTRSPGPMAVARGKMAEVRGRRPRDYCRAASARSDEE